MNHAIYTWGIKITLCNGVVSIPLFFLPWEFYSKRATVISQTEWYISEFLQAWHEDGVLLPTLNCILKVSYLATLLCAISQFPSRI